MELKELNEKIELLETSPIRQYLKDNDKISLFENEKIELREIDKIINKNKENLNNPLKIVVLGEIKAGKSTLVNALIGKKVSYTNVVEATAAILEVKYSSEEKIIIERKNERSINLSSLEVLDELMNNNRDNQEFFNKISKITVFTNTTNLKEITLVDTPGLNTVTSENAERTKEYIAEADVILWILNSNHLGQSDVSERIEEVLSYGKNIICVLNRIDEINGDPSELVEYVQNEMGYMFSEVFAISAKQAWDGYIEEDSSKVAESHIDELYKYIVNNIEANAEQVQKESIMESMKIQVMRDLYTHKNIKLRINGMMKNFELDLRELKRFNYGIKQTINSKINDWIDNKFFKDEMQLIMDCKNDSFTNIIEKYSNDIYLQKLINDEYEELKKYLFDEWTNNTEQFINKENQNKLEAMSIVITGSDTTKSSSNVLEDVKQVGATVGAVGLGLAGYAALLGPAATYVTIGSVVAAFVPPLLIASVVGGAVWKAVGKSKDEINKLTQLNDLVLEIRSSVKDKVISNMKSNLDQASDYYYNNSELMIMSILKQCNTSKEQVNEINIELSKYIDIIGNNIIVDSEEDNNPKLKDNINMDVFGLIQYGAEKEHDGDLKGAKELYIKALKLEPCNIKAYIAMGKVCYLLNERETSICSYLAAMHIQIYNRENCEDSWKIINDGIYDSLDVNIKTLLPTKSAMVIFEDPDTSRNITHSILDFNQNLLSEDENLQIYSQIYRSELYDNDNFKYTLNKLGKTEEEYQKFEDNYLSIGRKILLANIDWNNINDSDVSKIYLNGDKSNNYGIETFADVTKCIEEYENLKLNFQETIFKRKF